MERLQTDLKSLVGCETTSREAGTCSSEVAAQAVAFLLGQFRRSDIASAETYVPSLVAVLSDYPEAVVRAVVDPRGGIATRCGDFPPSISRLKEECERHMLPVRARRKREQEQARAAAALPPPVERSGRKSFAELQAECKRRGGMVPSERRGSVVPTPLSPEAAAKLLADLAERAKQPSGVKASDELLAKLQEER